MIFVTIGTFNFDPLIEYIDSLVEQNIIQDKVICQIGNGSYTPKNCEHFKYTKEIETYINKSDLVVSHGGTGSILGLISLNKPFVAVANTSLADNHQAEFLKKLSEERPIQWISDLTKLPLAISNPTKISHHNQKSENTLSKYVRQYLLGTPSK